MSPTMTLRNAYIFFWKPPWKLLGKKCFRYIIISLLFIALLFISNMANAEVQITGLQVAVGAKAHHWTLNFITTGPVKYKSFTLEHPARVVIDIDGVAKKPKFNHALLFGTSVKDIRVGMHKGHRLRLVLDLSRQPKTVTTTLLAPNKSHAKYRLAVSLQGTKIPVVAFGKKTHKKNSKKSNKKSHATENHHSTTRSILSQPAFTALDARTHSKHSRNIIIVVDAGHGGKDPGATGPDGTHEKTVVLAIAKDLKRDINGIPGFKAVLTRKGDYYLHLRDRLKIARKDKADMFISIHADAYKNASASGASVFALSQHGATSEAARWVAERENASELMGGVDLGDKTRVLKSVLLSLSQTASIRTSLKIGNNILDDLKHVTPLHHDKVEQAAFVVLKSPDIPSLLVETGFISNRKEEKALESSHHQHRLAHAIAKGVRAYFERNPPRGTWLSDKKYGLKGTRKRYVVKSGDTLSAIAVHYRSSVKAIEEVNKLHSARIHIGQVLYIPGTEAS